MKTDMLKPDEFKVDREALSEKINTYTVDLEMSEKSWYDLALQKRALLKALSLPEYTRRQAESIQGLIHLLDSIQDQAVDLHGLSEDIVFPYKEE